MLSHTRYLIFVFSLALFGSALTTLSARADSDPAAQGSVVFIDFDNQKVNIHAVVQNTGNQEFKDPSMIAFCYLKFPNGVVDLLNLDTVAPLGSGQSVFVDAINVPFWRLFSHGTPQIVVELIDAQTGQRYTKFYDANALNNYSNFFYPIY